MIGRFEGLLLKQPGKTTLRTKEGSSAVQEAIDYLKRLGAVRELRWNNELYTASREHVLDIGSKGLV